MSYPYLGDFLNDVLGTSWNVPIPMFGAWVAVAIVAATKVAKIEVMRLEGLGELSPAGGSKSVPVHTLLPDLIMIATLFGVLGARLFHIFEYPHSFLENPWDMLFSRGGFSIYGGLLMGGAAGAIYVKKRAVPLLPMLDAIAPALAIGYGIGRIGCQVSGDGDWGTTANMTLKPDWVPDWFWTQTYENNILGVTIASPGVYPTPVYETLAAFGIFGFLWLFRSASHSRGYLFSIYLLLSGFSRLLVEKIRVNADYHFFGMNFTQAELISCVLIICGLLGILQFTQARRIPKAAFAVIVAGLLSACSTF